MEYHTVFRVVLGYAPRSRMIAGTARYIRNHANPSGRTENDVKYREIFHFDDTPPRAKKENPKYTTSEVCWCYQNQN